MEATAPSVEDLLVDGLSFKLRQGASYITNRRSVTYYPHGGNQYSPTGVKVIKLMLTGSDWLDPSTLRMMFDLRNTDTNPAHLQYPISGPWCFFRRLRILCGGQMVEDIDYYNHVHELFHTLQPYEVRQNDDIEGFGNGLYAPATNSTDLNSGIPGGSSTTVGFKFLSGLLNQDKFLPIRYCPITIELELVNQFTDSVIALNAESGVTQYKDNVSSTWQIENVTVKADVVTLDNSLDNEYAQHLLEGKSLPISYSSYVSQSLSLQTSGGIWTANVTRSFTRLKSLFLTTYNNTLPRVQNQAYSSDMARDWNYFWHPMATDARYNPQNEMELQIQVGSKLFPEYPVRTIKESFYQLRKCLGIHSSTWHSVNIKEENYRMCQFIFGMDTEKMLAAGFTGLNTKAGDLMTVRAKCTPTDPSLLPSSLFVVLHSDQILNIRDTGVEVLE